MAKYLLSTYSVEGVVGDPMTDEEMQQSWKQIQALNEEMKAAGAWVFGGALHDPDTATVVRLSDGEVLTTDGPFAEPKGNRTRAREPKWGHIGATIGGETRGIEGKRRDMKPQVRAPFALIVPGRKGASIGLENRCGSQGVRTRSVIRGHRS